MRNVSNVQFKGPEENLEMEAWWQKLSQEVYQIFKDTRDQYLEEQLTRLREILLNNFGVEEEGPEGSYITKPDVWNPPTGVGKLVIERKM